LTPEVVEARIACRVAELRVLAARTSILAARAQELHHIPRDIWFAAKADVARAIATAIAKRKRAGGAHARRSPNGTLWNFPLAFAGAHSAFAPENLITLAHFSVSSAMRLRNSLGEPRSTVPPSSANFALILASARAALISVLSLSMTS